MFKSKLFLFVLLGAMLGGGIGLSSALAQQQGQSSLQIHGLAVTPFLIETTVEPGQQTTEKIFLTNTTDRPLPIDISINDFVAEESSGQAKFLPVGEENKPEFSLSSWITITKQPQFVIPPNQETEVEFTITPPKDAEPGTHYGGLLFSYRPSESKSDTVIVTEKVGVLVLAEYGKGRQNGNITDLSAESSGSNVINFFLSFYNQGNVHLKPKGEVYIRNILGQQVGSVAINRDAQIVMPEGSRLFEAEWQPGWRLGRYTAEAVLFYGNPKIEVRAQTVIWIVPWQRLLTVIFFLVLALFVLRYLLYYYKKHIIKRANGSRAEKGPNNKQ
jgi:hypothetical protein